VGTTFTSISASLIRISPDGKKFWLKNVALGLIPHNPVGEGSMVCGPSPCAKQTPEKETKMIISFILFRKKRIS
jgi:hypothetical protein